MLEMKDTPNNGGEVWRDRIFTDEREELKRQRLKTWRIPMLSHSHIKI